MINRRLSANSICLSCASNSIDNGEFENLKINFNYFSTLFRLNFTALAYLVHYLVVSAHSVHC